MTTSTLFDSTDRLGLDMLLLDYPKLSFEHNALAFRARTGRAAPKLLEISPVNRCNHRCIFCCFEWLERTAKQLDLRAVRVALADAAALGRRARLKGQAVFFSGEGEPLLHPDIVAMTRLAAQFGFACAVNTNGVRLCGDRLEVIDVSQYIRISVNGLNPRDFARVHRARSADFDVIMSNLRRAVAYRNRANPACNINVQFIHTGQDAKAFRSFLRTVVGTGTDLLTIKGAYQHPHMRFKVGKLREGYAVLKDIARDWNGKMRIELREPGFAWRERAYSRCYGPEWFVEIAADGNCYPCGPYVGVKRFSFGNVNEERFARIWWSPRHRSVLGQCRRMAGPCQEMCRLDITNRFLFRLYNRRKEDAFL